MLSTLKAEFRKLLTIRSTYIISILAILLSAFFSFYLSGFKVQANDALNPFHLQGEIIGTIGILPLFGALVAILLIAHEYRYNTIMYTLTSSNSRSKVLLAKFVTVTIYSVTFVAVGTVFSTLAMYLGLGIKDISLVDQTVYWKDIIWQGLFYAWGYGIAGLLLGFLFRHVVGSIATLFLFPSTVEPLLGLLLKENAKYLPFTSLNYLNNPGPLSPGKAAQVFGVYLLVGWIVAWILFKRRDAN
jgi:ABC-2 type transport system permease protein